MTFFSLHDPSPEFSDERILAFDGKRCITWGDFRNTVTYRRNEQSAIPGRRRVLLDDTSPFDFLASLIATLAEDNVAVIPPNFQAQTLTNLATLPSPTDSPQHSIELYTSGSSGAPKCLRKTWRQLETECRVLESCWGQFLTSGTTVLATTPHHHIYGLLFRLLWPMLSGRPFDNSTISDPGTLMERLAFNAPYLLVSSPAQLSRLHQLLDISAVPNRPLLVFSSGGPLNAGTADQYLRAWGKAPIEIYGSTESGGIAWRQQNQGAHWTPLPGVELASADDGALLVCSPFLHEANPLRMEDSAELNENGTFLLRGRLDRIIKIEEKRLSLPEMESWLNDHPEVNSAVLAPLNFSGRTQIGALIVTTSTAPPRKILLPSLREHLLQRFEPVLLPRRWRFIDAIPYNDRGKISLDEIVQLLERAPCA